MPFLFSNAPPYPYAMYINHMEDFLRQWFLHFGNVFGELGSMEDMIAKDPLSNNERLGGDLNRL